MYMKTRIWLKDQAAPVLCTHDAAVGPILPNPANPDFIKFQNLRGGDWIIPKSQIVKIQVCKLDDGDTKEITIINGFTPLSTNAPASAGAH